MSTPAVQKTIRFFTDTGIEVPAVTADQMREIDRIATEETGPNLFQMMENAGRNLALLALEILGDCWTEASVMVLAGTGGNGGGGICAARHLANRRVNVKLCLVEPTRLAQVPAFQWKIFQSTSGQKVEPANLQAESPDLILDAIFGYGLNSAPHGTQAELIRWANASNAPILALDIPSGLHATSGQTYGDFIKARWTMTLALPKIGLSPGMTGDLFLADIGIPEGTYRRMGLNYLAPFGNRFRVHLTTR